MTIDLGNVAAAWSVWAFLAAALFGLAFGYLVFAPIFAQPLTGARAHGWLVGVLLAYWIVGLGATQVLVALILVDSDWQRIVSRVGVYLVGALATGVGVWLRLR